MSETQSIRRRASYSSTSSIRSLFPSEIASHLPSAHSPALDYLDLHGSIDSIKSARDKVINSLRDVEGRMKIYIESLPSSSTASHTSVKRTIDICKDLIRQLHDLQTDFRSSLQLQLPGVQDKVNFVNDKLKSIVNNGSANREQAYAVLERWDEIYKIVEKDLQLKAQRIDSVVESSFDSAKKSIEKALQTAQNGARLIKFSELPDTWKNNEHILTGYRFIPIDNKRELFMSAFKWHNETVNVQTHLWAAVGVFTLLLWHIGAPHPHWIAPDSHWSDKLVMVIFLLAALKCLIFSSLWHIHAGCADEKYFEHYACVDYVGISSLITASVTGVTFYGLYCDNITRNTLLTFIISNAVIGSYLPFTEVFNKRESRGFRISFFVYMATCAIAPILAMITYHGYENTINFLFPIIPSLAFYIIGLIIYAFQIPECFAPGRFDFAFASHNAWHIAVAAAIFLHYEAIVIMYESRYQFACQ